MTRRELIRTLAQRRGLAASQAEAVISRLFEDLRRALCEGRRVEIRGFGTFHARHYPASVGRNPRTSAPVAVERKVLPVFRPGRELERRLRAPASEAGGRRGESSVPSPTTEPTLRPESEG